MQNAAGKQNICEWNCGKAGRPCNSVYFFFAALTLAHLALAAARIRARPAGEILRFGRTLPELAFPGRVLPLRDVKIAMALSKRSRSSLSCWIAESKFAIRGL
jgi:hypothetical protein